MSRIQLIAQLIGAHTSVDDGWGKSSWDPSSTSKQGCKPVTPLAAPNCKAPSASKDPSWCLSSVLKKPSLRIPPNDLHPVNQLILKASKLSIHRRTQVTEPRFLPPSVRPSFTTGRAPTRLAARGRFFFFPLGWAGR